MISELTKYEPESSNKVILSFLGWIYFISLNTALISQILIEKNLFSFVALLFSAALISEIRPISKDKFVWNLFKSSNFMFFLYIILILVLILDLFGAFQPLATLMFSKGSPFSSSSLKVKLFRVVLISLCYGFFLKRFHLTHISFEDEYFNLRVALSKKVATILNRLAFLFLMPFCIKKSPWLLPLYCLWATEIICRLSETKREFWKSRLHFFLSLLTLLFGMFSFISDKYRNYLDIMLPFFYIIQTQLRIIGFVIGKYNKQKIAEVIETTLPLPRNVFEAYQRNIPKKKFLYFHETLKRIFKYRHLRRFFYLSLAKFHIKKRAILFCLEIAINFLIVTFMPFRFNFVSVLFLIYLMYSMTFRHTKMRFILGVTLLFPLLISTIVYQSIFVEPANYIYGFFSPPQPSFVFNALVVLLFFYLVVNMDLKKEQSLGHAPESQDITTIIANSRLYKPIRFITTFLTIICFYYFLKDLLATENVPNLILLLGFLLFLMFDTEYLLTNFRVIVFAQTFQILIVFIYNSIDPELFKLSYEKIFGLQFLPCLNSQIDVYRDNFTDCHHFRKLLVLNFFFRAHYFCISRIPHIEKSITPSTEDQLPSLWFSLLGRFNVPITMLVYIFISASNENSDHFALCGLIIVMIFFVFVIISRLCFKEELKFQKSCAFIFKFFTLYHLVITGGSYIIRLVTFFYADTTSDKGYFNLTNSSFLFADLLKNQVFTKKDFFNFIDENALRSANVSALRTVLILISTRVLRSFMKTIKQENERRWSKNYLMGLAYSLFFVFISLSAFYFVNFPREVSDATRAFNVSYILILLVGINVLLFTFFKVCDEFNFKEICRQEIGLFQKVLCSDPERPVFSWLKKIDQFSLMMSFLKKEYRKKFFDRLRENMLNKTLALVCFGGVVLIIFWSVIHVQTRIHRNRIQSLGRTLTEILLFATFYFMIYVMRIVKSEKEFENIYNPSENLKRINHTLITLISRGQEERQIKSLYAHIEALERFCAEHPTEWEAFQLKDRTGSQKSSKEYIHISSPPLVKLTHLPGSKRILLVALCLQSLSKLIREAALSFSLIMLTRNLNGGNVIMIASLLGLRLMRRLSFTRMLIMLSVCFYLRIFNFLNSKYMAYDILKLFTFTLSKSISFLRLEFLLIGSSIILPVPLILMLQVIFKDFGKRSRPQSEFCGLEEGVLRIDYFNWFSNSLIEQVVKIYQMGDFPYFQLFLLLVSIVNEKVVVYFFACCLFDGCRLILRKFIGSELSGKLCQVIIRSVLLVYILSTILLSVLGNPIHTSKALVAFAVILDFRLRIEKCAFFSYRLEANEKFRRVCDEAQLLLEDTRRNDEVLRGRLASRAQLEQLLSASKYSQKVADYGPAQLFESNFLFFQRVFAPSTYFSRWFNHIFFQVLTKMPQSFYEPPVHTFAVLARKYRFVPELGLDWLAILKEDAGPLEDFMSRVREYRGSLVARDAEVTRRVAELRTARTARKVSDLSEVRKEAEASIRATVNFAALRDTTELLRAAEEVSVRWVSSFDEPQNFSTGPLDFKTAGLSLRLKNFKYRFLLDSEGNPSVGVSALAAVTFAACASRQRAVLLLTVVSLFAVAGGLFHVACLTALIFLVAIEKKPRLQLRGTLRRIYGLCLAAALARLIAAGRGGETAVLILGSPGAWEMAGIACLFLLSNCYQAPRERDEGVGEASVRLWLSEALGDFGHFYDFPPLLLLKRMGSQVSFAALKQRAEVFVDHLVWFACENISLRNRCERLGTLAVFSYKQYCHPRQYKHDSNYFFRNFSFNVY